MTRGRTLGIALATFTAAAIGTAAALARSRRGAEKGRLAHRADGSDDSASFAAHIADEGTIPDVPPERLLAAS